MSDVFLSYNQKDKDSARQLYERLTQKNLDVWFAEERIQLGESLAQGLERGLREARAIAVLVGQAEGPWQALEVEVGIREYVYKGLPLFPILLQGSHCDLIPMLLKPLVYLDLSSSYPYTAADIDALAFAVRSRTRGETGDYVRELHTFEHDFLQVLLDKFSLFSLHDGAVKLEVELDHKASTIATREARRFVRKNNSHFDETASELDLQLEDVYAGTADAFNHEEKGFPFRFASGGTVPILEIDGTNYYCLFLRALHPIGWNLANGGCNSVDDLRDPTKTILRELREELIVVQGDKWYIFGAAEEDWFDRPEFKISREYWNSRFQELGLRRFDQLHREPLQIQPPAGPDTLIVKCFDDPPCSYDSLFVSVTAEDYGIEIDRALELKDLSFKGLVLCDGEINGGRSVKPRYWTISNRRFPIF